MITNYTHIYQRTNQLRTHYTTLNQLKTTKTPPPEIPTHTPTGPKPPTNIHWLTIEQETTIKLTELTHALADILATQPPQTNPTALLHWLDHHALTITTNPETLDLTNTDLPTITEELTNQLPNTQPPTTPKWETQHSILIKLKRYGYTVTPKQLYNWTYRGHITSIKTNRRNYYQLPNVLAYLTDQHQLDH